MHAQRIEQKVSVVQIFRVVTEWSGFNGAPGYTNLFFRNVLPGGAPTGVDEQISALAATERVTNFFTSLVPQFPDDVTFTVQSVVDILEDTTGDLVESVNVDPIDPIRGTQPGAYSAATGAVCGWRTSTILRNRRISGRTFLVPLAGFSFSQNGRIATEDVNAIRAAAESLAIGGVNSTFGVWARPIVRTEKNPDADPRPGQWAECTGVSVTNLPAVLRSRRD